jgi:hypothetical protein
MPRLLKAVRQFVGADSAGFFWVDSAGDMTSLYAERLLPASAMKLYFERYYDARESSFRREFTARVGRREPAIAVSPSAAWERSPYYNEVFRPLDAHHVLYGIVREQGQAIGQLSLYRPKSAPPFSAAQRSELSSIVPYIGHGVSQLGGRVADWKQFLDTEDDAVFLIGADGGIRQLSAASQRLLAIATLGKIGPASKDAVPVLVDARQKAMPAPPFDREDTLGYRRKSFDDEPGGTFPEDLHTWLPSARLVKLVQQITVALPPVPLAQPQVHLINRFSEDLGKANFPAAPRCIGDFDQPPSSRPTDAWRSSSRRGRSTAATCW